MKNLQSSPDRDWMQVAKTAGNAEAELIAGLLRSANIPTNVMMDGAWEAMGLPVGQRGGASVLVPETLLGQARDLLKAYPDDDTVEALEETDAELEMVSDKESVACPNCWQLNPADTTECCRCGEPLNEPILALDDATTADAKESQPRHEINPEIADELLELERKVENEPDGYKYVADLASTYADAGLWNEAIETFRDAIFLEPERADLHNDLGVVYEEAGFRDKAEDAYMDAIGFNPRLATTHLNLAELYEKQGKIGLAGRAYGRVMDYSKDPAERKVAEERIHVLGKGKSDSAEADTSSPMGTYEQMLKEIESEGKWFIGWGILNLVVSSLSGPFGLMLILVGVASHFYTTAAMLFVYGVIWASAVVMNLAVGETMAVIFAIIQVPLSVRAFLRFRRYRKIETEVVLSPVEGIESGPEAFDRARRVFPWAGLLLGLVSIIGTVFMFVGLVIWFAVSGGIEPNVILIFIYGLSIQMGVLALAVSLASLLSSFRYKVVSLLGAMTGGVTLLVLVFFLVVG